MKTTWIEEQLQGYKEDAEYKTEVLLLDINEQLIAMMERLGVKRSELAKRLGVSRAHITQVLEGQPNITVKTLCKIATAVGLDIKVEFTLPSAAGNKLVSFGKPIDSANVDLMVDESALAA